MNRKYAGALALIASAVITACGGGDDTPPARGSIVTAQSAGSVTTAQIDQGNTASGLSALAGPAACGVDIRHILYMTRDPRGEPATASTAVFVPTGSSAQCSGNRPVVLYAHGTTTTKSYNIADLSRNATTGAFNNAAGGEGSLVMSMYAAQGFIVVAPNYLGYDKSSLNYHPYLNAEAQAVDMIDGLRAAKTYLASTTTGSKPSNKLFLTGYSQGGHVAMATHRALERDHAAEFTVSGAAPMSGPYNMVGFADIINRSTNANEFVNAGATLFVPLLIVGYQQAYGNIYAQPGDVFQQPYAATIETLLPTDTPVETLLQQGKLPADATFTRLFGPGGLLTDAFRTGYATSNYRKAAVQNTLAGTDGNTPIGWKPKAPVALCGGAQDPTVFFQVNTQAAASVFANQGVTVPVWNLEAPPAQTDPTFPVYAGFAQAKAQTFTAGGDAAVKGAYHGSLVPPFCNALARGFFTALAAQP